MVKRNMINRLIALIYPERCCCCGSPVPCGKLICEDCRPKLKFIKPPVCSFCACMVQHCSCDRRQRHTDRCIAPFYFEGAAKSAIYRLKFKDKANAAELLCLAMAYTVRREYENIDFDCIVPVPLSRDILRKRRYNQSSVLAKGLANLINVPYADILKKQQTTAPQRELPAFRRSGNVLGVFDAVKDVPDGGTVLLVDDTVTTGSTLDECAKILKLYGAQAVYAVTATVSRLSNQSL